MNAGSITFSTELDNKELESQLSGLKKKITRQEDEVNRKQAARAPLAEQSQQLAADLDAAKARLDYMKSRQSAISSESITQQAETVSALQGQWTATQSRVERYDTAIAKATTELNYNKEKAGAIAQELASAGDNTDAMGKATERANGNMGRFALRVREVVRSALVFTLITQALAKFREWVGNVITSNAQASESVARLKAALLTLAQPLVSVVIPAFTAFLNILTAVVTQLARIVSYIFGTTLSKSKQSAEALYKQTKAINSTGTAAKKAAKENEKYLASFDEIKQIGSNSSDAGSTSATDTSGIVPDFSAINGFDSKAYKDKIDEITAYASGALLALGVILTFSGANIPLGLGLIAMGAAGLAYEIKENWNALNPNVQTAIDNVLLVLGGASLAIGSVLAFSGANVPLGIGLMALGAASIATKAMLPWNGTQTEVSGALRDLLLIVGGSLLAVGAVLALSGSNIPLGIGLMASGAVSLVTAAVINWGFTGDRVRGAITAIDLALGASLLAIGAVLAFSGANLPLGIGLIAVGAMALANAVRINWDTITAALRNGPLKDIMIIMGGSLLALGAVLAFSGANIPLGIGMMVAGGAALATVAAVNWDVILDHLKDAWKNIKLWWQTDIAPIFTKGWWEGKFDSIRAALVKKIGDAVNGGIALFNQFIGWVNEKLNISWPGLTIKGKEIIPAGSFQLLTIPPIPPLQIPALAAGAVIPPNREFLAMLGDQKIGTNIEAPESLIRRIVREETGGGGEMTINNIMELDGEVVYRNQKKVSRRHGTVLA